MENKDWKTFREYLGGVYEQYGKPAPTDAGARIMFEALRGLTLPQVLQGLNAHVKNNRFTPPNAAAVLDEVTGRPEDRAREAYGKVMKALRKINSGESVKFSDPCIHWALANGCGGWTGFARMEAVDAQGAFEKFYVSAVRLGKTWGGEGVPDHMPGEREQRGSVLNPWTPEQVVTVDEVEPALKQLTA